MIKLFVSDIDGCLAEPYRPYNLAAFDALARLAAAGNGLEHPGAPPDFSLCSGRAYAYVEAMSQVLGLRAPVLFESGGGIFDPVLARVTWHPAFSPEIEKRMMALREWLMEEVLPTTSMMYDYGKRTQAGIIGPDAEEVKRMLPVVEQYVAERYPELDVLHTSVSIDIVAPGITKKDGLEWLCGRLDVSLEEIAYIGDTHGDIPALEVVGASFAPANASADVKDAVDIVTRSPYIQGVIEAYRSCLSS